MLRPKPAPAAVSGGGQGDDGGDERRDDGEGAQVHDLRRRMAAQPAAPRSATGSPKMTLLLILDLAAVTPAGKSWTGEFLPEMMTCGAGESALELRSNGRSHRSSTVWSALNVRSVPALTLGTSIDIGNDWNCPGPIFAPFDVHTTLLTCWVCFSPNTVTGFASFVNRTFRAPARGRAGSEENDPVWHLHIHPDGGRLVSFVWHLDIDDSEAAEEGRAFG